MKLNEFTPEQRKHYARCQQLNANFSKWLKTRFNYEPDCDVFIWEDTIENESNTYPEMFMQLGFKFAYGADGTIGFIYKINVHFTDDKHITGEHSLWFPHNVTVAEMKHRFIDFCNSIIEDIEDSYNGEVYRDFVYRKADLQRLSILTPATAVKPNVVLTAEIIEKLEDLPF